MAGLVISPEGLQLIGAPAPVFDLPNQHGEQVTHEALRGRPAFLIFFPAAFSPICDGELRELQRRREGLEPAHLLAVSTDTKFSLRAYAEAEGLGLELLSDHWPHGEVCRRYAAFDDTRGAAHRVSVLIDSHGVIRDVFQSEAGARRPISRYLQALASLQALGQES